MMEPEFEAVADCGHDDEARMDAFAIFEDDGCAACEMDKLNEIRLLLIDATHLVAPEQAEWHKKVKEALK